MNKLYVVNYRLPNGYLLKTASFWSQKDLEAEIDDHPDFDFELERNDEWQVVYNAS